MAHNFLSELTGSFAMPAAENPTVAMVEAAYRHHGLDWRYINCEVTPQNLGAAVRRCPRHELGGLQLLAAAQGRGDPASRRARANRPRSWAPSIASCAAARRYIGENTDGKGFLASLDELVDPAGRSVVMFGAGGAARAIGVELALAGASKHHRRQPRSARAASSVVDLLNDETEADAELVEWSQTYRIPRRHRHRRQRHLDRPLSRRRRPARSRPRFAERRA